MSTACDMDYQNADRAFDDAAERAEAEKHPSEMDTWAEHDAAIRKGIADTRGEFKLTIESLYAWANGPTNRRELAEYFAAMGLSLRSIGGHPRPGISLENEHGMAVVLTYRVSMIVDLEAAINFLVPVEQGNDTDTADKEDTSHE